MLAILFALVAFFGWSLADTFSTISSRKIGGASAMICSLALGLFFTSFYIPFAASSLHHLTWSIFAIMLFCALILIVGGIAFNESSVSGNPALIVAISSSFIALVVILSVLFLHQTLTPVEVIAIVIIFLGVLLSSVDLGEIRKGKLIDRGVGLALFAALCWGIGYTFVQVPIHAVGWFWPSYLGLLLFPIFLIGMKTRHVPFKLPRDKHTIVMVMLYAFFISLSEFSYNIALSKGYGAIVAPIAGSYPALFGIIAYFVFKDKITRRQVTGAAVTIAGIVFLTIVSGAS